MSLDQLSLPLLLVCGLALAITSLVNVAGAAVYDVQAAKRRQQRQAHPYARRYRWRPLVTVLVMAQDNEPTIGRCLEALRRSSYRKLQIIIIDNASADATKTEVKSFLAAHPKLNARLVAKRRPTPWAEALRTALKVHAQGELVIPLDAGNFVDKYAVQHAADYYNDQPGADMVAARIRPMAPASLGGLMHKYLSLLAGQPAKAASLLPHAAVAATGGACYRRDTLAMLLHKTAKPSAAAHQYAYVHDMIIDTPAADSVYRLSRQHHSLQLNRQPGLHEGRLQTWIAAIFTICTVLTALLIPLLATYFIYLALVLHEPLFLILSMAVLGLFLLSAVWEDERLGLKQRLAYTAGIPVTYSLFYGLAWLRLLTTARTVVAGRSMTKSF